MTRLPQRREAREIVIARPGQKRDVGEHLDATGHPLRETIVGEVSVNWCTTQPAGQLLVSQRFEMLIEHNADRGYDLVSHSHSSVVFQDRHDGSGDRLCETIIAVFRRRGGK